MRLDGAWVNGESGVRGRWEMNGKVRTIVAGWRDGGPPC